MPVIDVVRQHHPVWWKVVVSVSLVLAFYVMSTATSVDAWTQLAMGEKRAPMIAYAGIGALGMIPPFVEYVRLDDWSLVRVVVLASMMVTFGIVCVRLVRLLASRDARP